MQWEDIIGHTELKLKLKESINNGRVSHAQLFSGTEGTGTLLLALAYARKILCGADNNSCTLKLDSLQHPDLHFIYPTANLEDGKKTTSKSFALQWRDFLTKTPYGSLFDWLVFLGIEKKQGQIGVDDAQDVLKNLSLKSYEGGYKIMIIWMVEKMNHSASNKLLKILEEPPEKTLFLLVTEDEESILPTILSRCQLVKVNRLTDGEIANYLIGEKNVDTPKANHIAYEAQGNLRLGLQLMDENQSDDFDLYFVQWIRNAFMAKAKPQVLKHLVVWANDLSTWGRERQKQFLQYAIQIFRQALLTSYNSKELVFVKLNVENFNWDAFSKYITGSNIQDILSELSTAHYHIERNANAKIVFLDLSIMVTRHLHKKQD